MTKNRTRRDGDGFTLIELSVVVVVIGVLVTVAIITLLGAQKRAQDTSAKSIVRQGTKTQRVHYSDRATYTTNDSVLESLEPSVDFEPFVDSGAVVRGRVYVRDSGNGVVTMVAESASGTCFWTREEGGVTSYATNDCSGVPEASAFGRSW